MSSDPFGRAIRDHHRSERDGPLVQHDGEETQSHPIEEFYFGDASEDADWEWLTSWLDGPLLDAGAGAGQHALAFQSQFEVVAIEQSEALVETMHERGVRDARQVDMFDLRETFERDRFQSVLVNGTQVGLSRSMQGLREFLGDLAFVSGPDATAIVDSYDPTVPETKELHGYRGDPTPGLAYRVLTFEYAGETSETLLFRLFSPDRLRAGTAGTGWTVSEILRPEDDIERYYRATLTKA